MRHTRMLTCSLAALVVLIVGVTSPEAWAAKKKLELEISRIYWEYNSSANDLGVHVSLDGEDWRKLKIINPAGRTIFEVEGHGPYRLLGMTELFFEGAEPNLDDFPLENLLARFPEGDVPVHGPHSRWRCHRGHGAVHARHTGRANQRRGGTER